MQGLEVFVLVCVLLMLPFLAYLIYHLVLFIKNKKSLKYSRAKKEEYVFYEIDEKGNLIRLE